MAIVDKGTVKGSGTCYMDDEGYIRFKDSHTLMHYHNVMIGKNVHHIDGNKLNNHPSNLIIVTRQEHMAIEARINELKNKIRQLESLNLLREGD